MEIVPWRVISAKYKPDLIIHHGGHGACLTALSAGIPSVVSTILRYVESGAGIGIVPESLGDTESSARWSLVPLTPSLTIPLVMVWKQEHEEPPVIAFRSLVSEWLRARKL